MCMISCIPTKTKHAKNPRNMRYVSCSKSIMYWSAKLSKLYSSASKGHGVWVLGVEKKIDQYSFKQELGDEEPFPWMMHLIMKPTRLKYHVLASCWLIRAEGPTGYLVWMCISRKRRLEEYQESRHPTGADHAIFRFHPRWERKWLIAHHNSQGPARRGPRAKWIEMSCDILFFKAAFRE